MSPIRTVFSSRRRIVAAIMVILLAIAIPVLAVLYDVTADDAIVDVGNGVLFWKTDLGPFGTGLVDAFLRIQDNDNDQQGYNTDAAPEFDEIDSFTDAMPLTEVPQTTINGVVYREVLLDKATNFL